jgi:hypothetical protein
VAFLQSGAVFLLLGKALSRDRHVTCHADVTLCHAIEEEGEEEKEYHSFVRSQNREEKNRNFHGHSMDIPRTFHGHSAECPYIEKEEEEEEEKEYHSFVHSQKRRLKFLKKNKKFLHTPLTNKYSCDIIIIRTFVRHSTEPLYQHERSTHGKERAEVPKIFAKASAYSGADRGKDRRAELLAKPI